MHNIVEGLEGKFHELSYGGCHLVPHKERTQSGYTGAKSCGVHEMVYWLYVQAVCGRTVLVVMRICFIKIPYL